MLVTQNIFVSILRQSILYYFFVPKLQSKLKEATYTVFSFCSPCDQAMVDPLSQKAVSVAENNAKGLIFQGLDVVHLSECCAVPPIPVS